MMDDHLAHLAQLEELGPDLEGLTWGDHAEQFPKGFTAEHRAEWEVTVSGCRAILGAIRRAVSARPPAPPVARRHLLEDRCASSEVRSRCRRLEALGPPPLLRLARSLARHAPPVTRPREVVTV